MHASFRDETCPVPYVIRRYKWYKRSYVGDQKLLFCAQAAGDSPTLIALHNLQHFVVAAQSSHNSVSRNTAREIAFIILYIYFSERRTTWK